MTFNEVNVNRKEDGKFGEKRGAKPEVDLKPKRRRRRLQDIFYSNETYADQIFQNTSDDRRFESMDKVYETSVWCTKDALQRCARENLERELTDEELTDIVDKHMWKGGYLGTQNNGNDFHEVPAWNAFLALEAVRSYDDPEAA